MFSFWTILQNVFLNRDFSFLFCRMTNDTLPCTGFVKDLQIMSGIDIMLFLVTMLIISLQVWYFSSLVAFLLYPQQFWQKKTECNNAHTTVAFCNITVGLPPRTTTAFGRTSSSSTRTAQSRTKLRRGRTWTVCCWKTCCLPTWQHCLSVRTRRTRWDFQGISAVSFRLSRLVARH